MADPAQKNVRLAACSSNLASNLFHSGVDIIDIFGES